MKIDLGEIARTFPKRVPVFPLPNAVLFPSAVLPLHIFEPRYQKMLADVLANDRLLALGHLKQCDTDEYKAGPPFREIVCVGHVVHHRPLAEGRSNIALFGVSAGTASEIRDDEPYRTASIELRQDSCDPSVDCSQRILRAFEKSVPGESSLKDLQEQLAPLSGREGLTAALVNTCALTAPIRAREKQALLEEQDVLVRLDHLLEYLERRWQWN